MTNYSITIGWLYPDLMSTYGDRGNILVLKKRCKLRGIDVHILPITADTPVENIQSADMLFGGGAQDIEQEIVVRDLNANNKAKASAIKEKILNGTPGLFVCGMYQLLGAYYKPRAGVQIEGINVFPMYSEYSGAMRDRSVGNVVMTITHPDALRGYTAVGFENHGGQTVLDQSAQPFGTIVVGKGNNQSGASEGCVYNNAIGCYLHGPLLPKNPEIADWLIAKTIEQKYGTAPELLALDDELAYHAKKTVIDRYI